MISTAKLRKALRDITVKKGEFALFGLFMRADAPGRWDLVVSASWLEARKLSALGEFSKLLTKSIGKESLQELSRIVALDRNDPAVEAVVSSFSVDDGELHVKHSSLFGLEIEDAIIIRSKKVAQ